MQKFVSCSLGSPRGLTSDLEIKKGRSGVETNDKIKKKCRLLKCLFKNNCRLGLGKRVTVSVFFFLWRDETSFLKTWTLNKESDARSYLCVNSSQRSNHSISNTSRNSLWLGLSTVPASDSSLDARSSTRRQDPIRYRPWRNVMDRGTPFYSRLQYTGPRVCFGVGRVQYSTVEGKSEWS